MPTIDIRRLYADGDVLTQADLDAIVDDIETFLNTTQIDGDNIQDGSITTAKLAGSSVTNAKLAANAVDTTQLVDGAVTTAKLAATSVTTAKIAAGAVTATELGTDAVTNAKIATGAVDTDELATDSVTAAKIAAGAVDTSELAASAVTAAKIADTTLTPTKVDNTQWFKATGVTTSPASTGGSEAALATLTGLDAPGYSRTRVILSMANGTRDNFNIINGAVGNLTLNIREGNGLGGTVIYQKVIAGSSTETFEHPIMFFAASNSAYTLTYAINGSATFNNVEFSAYGL